MSTFQNLARDGVERYAAFFQHNGCLWVFHHIPKTAGSSLTRELALVLPPYRNIHLRADAPPPPPAEPGVPRDPLMPEVEAFLEAHRTKNYTSASGHLRQPHLRRIVEAVPHAKTFTFLRDPVARLVSDYRYAKTPKHPPHREFAAKYPTIEHYLEDPGHQNKMWRFVRPRNGPPDAATLDLALRRYAFFGLVSELSLHFQFLTALTRCPRPPAAKVNVTADQENNAVALSPELRTRIELANAEDFALYAAVEAVATARRAEMAEFVAARRAFFLGD